MSRVAKNQLVEEMQIRSLARAISTQQKVVRVQPTTTTTIASGSTSTTRIELPSQDYLLPTTSHLQFELAFNATTNNWKQTGVSGAVRNIRVYVGDQLVDLLQQRNVFEKFLIDCGASTESYSFGFDSGMRGDTINDASASGTQHFTLRLSTGLLAYTGLLPLFAMPKISIEIDWAPAAECLYDNTNATPSYTISNIYFVGDTFVVDAAYTQSIMARLSQGQPIDFQYTSFRLAGPIGLAAGANPTGSYKINSQVRSAKFLVCGIRDNNNTLATNATGGTFHQPIAMDNEVNLTSYQLKIGNDIIPNQPLLFGPQSRVELKECLNQIGMYNELGNITRPQYLATTSYTSGVSTTTGNPAYAHKAWFGVNLEKFQNQLVQSGEDFMSRDVVLDLTAASNATTAKSLYVFVVYDAVLSLNSLYNCTVSF